MNQFKTMPYYPVVANYKVGGQIFRPAVMPNGYPYKEGGPIRLDESDYYKFRDDMKVKKFEPKRELVGKDPKTYSKSTTSFFDDEETIHPPPYPLKKGGKVKNKQKQKQKQKQTNTQIVKINIGNTKNKKNKKRKRQPKQEEPQITSQNMYSAVRTIPTYIEPQQQLPQPQYNSGSLDQAQMMNQQIRQQNNNNLLASEINKPQSILLGSNNVPIPPVAIPIRSSLSDFRPPSVPDAPDLSDDDDVKLQPAPAPERKVQIQAKPSDFLQQIRGGVQLRKVIKDDEEQKGEPQFLSQILGGRRQLKPKKDDYCDICKEDILPKNMPRHLKTKKHIGNVNQSPSVRDQLMKSINARRQNMMQDDDDF